jgi:hypothetical protein
VGLIHIIVLTCQVLLQSEGLVETEIELKDRNRDRGIGECD